MTDLELRLLHCEREPSEVALYDAADAFRDIDDLEMYHGLKYMADHKKLPFRAKYYYWWRHNYFSDPFFQRDDFTDHLPLNVIDQEDLQVRMFSKFSDSVRWLGKRLIELGMVSS